MIHGLLFLLAGALAQGPANDDAPAAPKEIATLHVLIAVDTDDGAGITWGRDGANVKALLETTFQKQKLAGRFHIDVFTDRNVTADKILGYYRSLKIGPDDGLLFYYSGHGGFTINKGHFLALTRGKLERKDLLAAMESLKPKLCVVLTDCCANYEGGAWKAEPKGAEAIARTRDAKPGQPPAPREEPDGKTRNLRVFPARPTPRPVYTGNLKRAPVEEPPATVEPIENRLPRNLARAARDEPPSTSAGLSKLPTAVGLPTLTTRDGKVRMKEILDASDGSLLRDLCFRNSGLVDINASTKGDYSYGTMEWGGSLFTNALIAVQKNSSGSLDRNKNHVVEWNEVFPELQRETQGAGRRVPGGVEQKPEATSLGSAIKQ